MASSVGHVSSSYERDSEHVKPAVTRGPLSADELDFPDSTDASGSEYLASRGVPGRGVVLISTLTTVGSAALNLVLTDALTIFFDLCFVVITLTAAMSVPRRDLFTVGVLPPLLFAAVIAGIAVLEPTTLVSTGGVSKAFLTGLAAHAVGLVAAYSVALAVVVCRVVSDKNSRSAALA